MQEGGPGLTFQNKDKKYSSLLLTVPNGRSAQVLLTLAIPGHLIFIYSIYLIQGSPDPPTAAFVFLYLLAAFTQASEREVSKCLKEKCGILF